MERYAQTGFRASLPALLNIGDTANGGIAGPTSTQLAKWDIPSNGKRHTFSFDYPD